MGKHSRPRGHHRGSYQLAMRCRPNRVHHGGARPRLSLGRGVIIGFSLGFAGTAIVLGPLVGPAQLSHVSQVAGAFARTPPAALRPAPTSAQPLWPAWGAGFAPTPSPPQLTAVHRFELPALPSARESALVTQRAFSLPTQSHPRAGTTDCRRAVVSGPVRERRSSDDVRHSELDHPDSRHDHEEHHSHSHHGHEHHSHSEHGHGHGDHH